MSGDVDQAPIGGGPSPLSHTQRAIWLAEQLHPTTTQNHISLAVHLHTELDRAAFRRGMERLVADNPSLWTRVHFADLDDRDDPGDPVWSQADAPDVDLRFVDAEEWSEAEVDDHLRRAHLERFDLEAGRPVRFLVLSRRPDDHLLLITIHHIVSDLWSIALLGAAIMAYYRDALDAVTGTAPQAPPRSARRRAPATYREYVEAEREYLRGPEAVAARDHWRTVIGSCPPSGLPIDHRASPDATDVSAVVDVELPPELVEAIGELAARLDASERSVVLGALQALLHRYSSSDHVAVAEMKAIRTARTARLIGCCLNTVPRIRSFDPTTTLAELVVDAEHAALASRPHDRYPFDLMLREARGAGGQDPLIDAAFAWQKTTRAVGAELVSALAIGSAGGTTLLTGVPVEAHRSAIRSSPFPLTLLAVSSGSGVRLAFEYQTERFERATVETLAAGLRVVLEAMVADADRRVSDLDLLTADARARLVAEWDAVTTPVAEGAVHRLVEAHARHSPDRLAVRAGDDVVTYRELDERANRLAHRLIAAGAGPGRLVGIALERSIDMVVAMLATWKSGAGYVPMDPGFPAERLEMMAADAELAVVITTRSVWEPLRAAARDDPGESSLARSTVVDLEEEAQDIDVLAPTAPDIAVGGDAVAYVIFTSGSTGRPKGVMIEHHSLVNFVASMGRRPGLAPDDVVLASTTLSFDISVLEILLPLTVGACAHVVDRSTVADPLLLSRALEHVTVAQGTPTMWNLLVGSGWHPTHDLTILCGGEPLPRALADELLARSPAVWNMYGPTETTIWSAVERVAPGADSVPIGSPIDNTRLYVLDGQRLAPDGVAGELWIGGAGVARGYIGRPDLTAERFTTDPFHHAGAPAAQGVEGDAVDPVADRMYRTGDLVRRRSDGSIEFLGRVDDQVKLRGHRIELGEIEAVLDTHPAIDRSVVAVRNFGPFDDRLVAYYTVTAAGPAGAAPADSVDPAVLRDHLRSRLPEYMVPAHYLGIEDFPRTPNDKIDRRRLPDPAPTGARRRAGAPAPPEEPVDPALVDAVVAVYREVLGDDDLGPADDFFDNGGHSLLATRIASRLRRTLQRSITLRAVLDHPTPASLARHVGTSAVVVDGPPDLTTGATTDGNGDATFLPSWSQERMWFMHELYPDSAAYNLAGAVDIRGPLDRGAFYGAWNELVARHTALRSTFESIGGAPRVRVHPPFTVAVALFDHRSTATADVTAEAIEPLLRDRAAQPFDLSRAPLFRVSLHHLAEDHHVVCVVMHHAISDQWSFGVLLREFGEIYRARSAGTGPAELPPAPRAERYAQWHRSRLGGDAFDELRDYWRSQLRDRPNVELPTDHPRPAIASTIGATIVRPLPQGLSDAVRATAASERATEFMVHLAVLDLLIGRLTGSADVPVGVPIANRHWLDSEGLIMSLVNTLVLRTDLSGATTFREVLRRVRRTALDAYAHQDMPFEQLVRELAPKRDLGRSPLFQVFLNVQNAPLAMPDIDGLELTVRQIERRAAQHDLSLSIDTSLTNTITLEYATDLFDDERMQRLLDDYVELLTTVVDADHFDATLPDLPQLDATRSDRADGAPASDGADDDPAGHRADDGADDAPRPGLETELAAIWSSALGVSDLRRHDDFFDLGGHSLLAVRMLADVEAQTGIRPPVSALFATPDLASFAHAIANEGWTSRWTSLIEVQPGWSRRPYFYVSPFLVTALSMHELAEHMGHDVPFYALQPQGIDTDDPVHQRVEDMAAHYIREMRTVQPAGPYLVGGHCGGAWVAFEVALQLQRAGERVGALIVVDVEPPGIEPPPTKWLRRLWSRLTLYARTGVIIHSLRWQARLRVERLRTRYHRGSDDRMELVRTFHRDAHSRYRGGLFDGDLTFIRSEDWANLYDKRWHREWATLATGRMTEIVVHGAHSELLTGEGVRELAAATRQVLDAAD